MKLLNRHQEMSNCRETGGKYEEDEMMYEQMNIHQE